MNCELEIAFHSCPQRSYSGVAQQEVRLICNQDVGGSSPSAGAINKQLSQKKSEKEDLQIRKKFLY